MGSSLEDLSSSSKRHAIALARPSQEGRAGLLDGAYSWCEGGEVIALLVSCLPQPLLYADGPVGSVRRAKLWASMEVSSVRMDCTGTARKDLGRGDTSSQFR